MNGKMVVARDQAEAERLLDACRPTMVNVWKAEDFPTVATSQDEETLSRGMHAFAKAAVYSVSCSSRSWCQSGAGFGESVKKLRGKDLLFNS